ncbi:MAG TPA: sulfotransferase, partial [Gammaproteobacteria bacterium]|nr:sulfotransferase [Gammaproteobacteria bacterium]
MTEQLAEWGCREVAPIFVVGSPRSGTTLIEQILASHSRVTGVGESGLVEDVLREYLADSGETDTSALSPQRCGELGVAYMARLRELAPGSERIVDKTPGNAHNLGFIRAILPNARIIHASRDPLDSGVSMFSLRFSRTVEFAFDLETLGLQLRGLQEHMAHWEGVLPADFLLRVEYEELVSDPERWVRELLTHCGLEWEDSCLRFFETRRAVRTASVTQVRQPIYRGSVGRWSRYAEHLLPLARAAGLEHRLPAEAREGFRSFSRLGERQMARGQFQEAIRSLRRAMMWENGRRGRINALLGRALEAAECFREAEACYQAAEESGLEPEGLLGPREDWGLVRIRCLRKARDLEQATVLLDRRGSPEEPREKAERAWLAWLSGDPDTSLAQFEEVLAEDGTKEVREGWARAARDAGRLGEVWEFLEQWATQEPADPLPLCLAADFLRMDGQLEEAEDRASQALEAAPDEPLAHTVAAACQFQRDRLEKAEQSVDRALALRPDHFPAHLWAARIQEAQGQIHSARESALAALGLRDDPDARLLWGRAQLLSGHGEAGLAEIRGVRERYPERASVWTEEARVLEELNRRKEALELLHTARARFPQDQDLRFLELRLLRQEGAGAEVLEGLLGLCGPIQEFSH